MAQTPELNTDLTQEEQDLLFNPESIGNFQQQARARGKKVFWTRAKIAGGILLGVTAAAAGAGALGLVMSDDYDRDGIKNDDDMNPWNKDDAWKDPNGDIDGDGIPNWDDHNAYDANDAQSMTVMAGGELPDYDGSRAAAEAAAAAAAADSATSDESGDGTGSETDASAEQQIDYSTMSNEELINMLLNDEQIIDSNNDGIDDRIAELDFDGPLIDANGDSIDDRLAAVNTFMINEQAYNNPNGHAIDQLTAAFQDVPAGATDDDVTRAILARMAADIYEDRGETAPDSLDVNGDGIDDLYGGNINGEVLQYTGAAGYLHVDRDGQVIMNPDRISQYAFGSSIIGELDGSDNLQQDLNYWNSPEGQAQLVNNWLHGQGFEDGENGTFYQPGNMAFFAANVYTGDLSQWFGDGATDNMVNLTELIERLDPDARADFNQEMTDFMSRCNVSLERWDGDDNYSSAYYKADTDADGNIIGTHLVQQETVHGDDQLVMRVIDPETGREQIFTTRCGVQPVFPKDPYIPEIPKETQPPVVTTNPPIVTTLPPVVTTHPPVITTQPPIITTEPPVVTTQPPVLTTPPPVITTQPPALTTPPPVITTHPPIITTEPPVTTPPPVITTPPPVITTHPPIITTHPPVITTHPPVITTEPPIITTHPPIITTEPPVITTHPPIVTTLPPVITTEPPIITTLPPVITTLPPVVTTLPPIITTIPPVITTLPPVITTLPPIVTTLPPIITTEPPIITTPPPIITTPPPEVTTLEPKDPTLKPTMPPTTTTPPSDNEFDNPPGEVPDDTGQQDADDNEIPITDAPGQDIIDDMTDDELDDWLKDLLGNP